MIVKYKMKSQSIVFFCRISKENNALSTLFNDFLLDISKGKNVFFQGRCLPRECASELIDPIVILAKAQALLEPFDTFFYLSAAKVNINYFDRARKASIFYFQDKVDWSEFLVSSVGKRRKELMKKGVLSACFTIANQGTECWFECNKTHENRVFELLESMVNLGYEMKRSFWLVFPNSLNKEKNGDQNDCEV